MTENCLLLDNGDMHCLNISSNWIAIFNTVAAVVTPTHNQNYTFAVVAYFSLLFQKGQ